MAMHETKRLSRGTLQADRDAYLALSEMEGYRPANTFYSQEYMAQLLQEMLAAYEQEVNVANALAAARDTTCQAEWRFHNAMLNVKAQVSAQYGLSSDEVQALGLKKKCERRRPARVRSTEAETPTTKDN